MNFPTHLGAGVSERPARRIVLAERDPDLRELLRSVLVTHGYGVTALATGSELLRSLIRTLDVHPHGFVPDVIVSETTMPGINGLEILSALRRAGSRVPVLLLSAALGENPPEPARAAGVFATLVKPFELSTFLHLVDRASCQSD